jgi:tetratricopeptide (TPR) repeat protein
MKKVIVLCLAILLSMALSAEINPRNLFLEYYGEPTMENFLRAYHYFTLSAETIETPVPVDMYLYLMHIHNMEAQRHLDSLAENLDSASVGMKFQIGNAFMDRGQFHKSIEIFEAVLRIAPEWSCPWRHMGEAYFRLKDFPNAERSLKKSIETRTTHYDAYLMLAEVYHVQKKNRLALTTIEEGFKFRGLDEEDEEEVYTIAEAQFLYLDILRANRDRRVATKERELRERFPDDKYWSR